MKSTILVAIAIVAMVQISCRDTPSHMTADTQPTEEPDVFSKTTLVQEKDNKVIMGSSDAETYPAVRPMPKVGEKVIRSEAEWKEILTPEQYRILREGATERRGTGKLNAVKESDGVYHCAACNAPLFEASTKYDSGSGWPSFYDKIKDRVVLREDNSMGMHRIEVLCASCGSHLGHVFRDGPEPTGLRYCINSAALNFTSSDSKEDSDQSHPPAEGRSSSELSHPHDAAQNCGN